jgi:hypothetical protein
VRGIRLVRRTNGDRLLRQSPRNTGIEPHAIAQTWRDRVHLEAHGSAAAESALGCRVLTKILEREAKLPKWERRSTASIGPCEPFACRGILRRRFVECAVAHEIDNRGRRGPLVTFGAVFRLSRSQGFSVA